MEIENNPEKLVDHKQDEDDQRIKISYIGHGLAGYYGIQRLMRGELRDEVEINAVIVSNTGGGYSDIVENIAKDYGLEVFRTPFTQEMLERIKESEYGVVMNFNQLVPKAVLEAPENGFYNVHQSDLPKYRGGLPLEYIVANGDDLRITVHKMEEQFDTGDIIYKSAPVKVWDLDIDELYSLSSKQSALALEAAIDKLIGGCYHPLPQDDSKATYALSADLDNLLRINWQRDDGEYIYRKVLAGGRNRGAIASINIDGAEREFRIKEANYFPNPAGKQFTPPGKVMAFDDQTYAISVNNGTLYISGIDEDIRRHLDGATLI
ncbi:hypothetical protein H6503_05015 [Candidatus Woesearchaeota archaeon]|nr:hypothetical protein [Candidatus Woesearchaeota archaeon]